MDKSTKKLLNGTMIYFIGNVLTQIMSLVLLRFITGRIAPEEYGVYNLVVTVSKLVTPFVTLQITDAVFKFLLRSDTESERKEYFTVTFVIAVLSSIVTVVGVFTTDAFFLDIPHPVLVTLYMITSNLYVLYQRLARSLGKNLVYVQGNLIKTAMYLVLQIALIYCFNLGAETLFLATIISEVFFLIFAELNIHTFRLLDFKCFKLSVAKSMIRFSAPLIPSATFWWLTSSVNTLIISTRCGLDVNGIYTVANKFSSVLTMVTTVFMMSWQESAIAEYGTEKFKAFFTKTFNMYFKLVFTAIATIVPFMSVVFPFMIAESYYASIPYAPFLLLVSGLSTISGFFSQIFSAQGKTQRSLMTNVVGMAVNLLVVLLLVDQIGLWAAVLGSMASEVALVLLRCILVRHEFQSGVEVGNILLTIVMLVVSDVLYFHGTTTFNMVWLVIAAAIAVYLNLGLVKDILSMFLDKLKKKKKISSDHHA
jgi:O-antigen/teichoic acid export membrane protein